VTVAVEAANTAPGLVLAAPADGARFVAGDPVDFAASASDAEDGDLSAAIAWSSDLAGALGSGPSLTLTDLAPGAHVVTAAVTDAGGLSASATVTVTVDPANTAPSLSITAPGTGAATFPGLAVEFAAAASDAEDGDLSATVAWSSDLDGPLGTGANVQRTDLAVGTHLVSAAVTDAGGLAASTSITLTVVPVAPPSSGCGVGPELAGLIPLLRALRRRREPA
jgi:hypothetical protein